VSAGEGKEFAENRQSHCPALVSGEYIEGDRSSDSARDGEEAAGRLNMAERDISEVASSRGTGGGPRACGLEFQRYFTKPGVNPMDDIEWDLRTVSIQNEKGETIFDQHEVKVPRSWSMTATDIIASNYFHGRLGTPERESSSNELVTRVVSAVTGWGLEKNYFSSEGDAMIFQDELTYLLVHQFASFSSPVWFNCGLWQHYGRSSKGSAWYWDSGLNKVLQSTAAYRYPQCAACFINSVEDNMESILTLAKTEGMLFRWGFGTGTNLSSLRSSCESLSGGGLASGPVSFMRGYDAFAGVIKSGGKAPRAAKMVILNINHPDIVRFIECKAREKRKAWTLIAAGYDAALDGEAYSSIFFQNGNHSVRVTDEFMEAVTANAEWTTRKVTTGEPAESLGARGLLEKIAQSAWLCGDPSIQFDSTINRWNPCKASGRINASNPCYEYMFLDDSACNLASLNLLKFLGDDGRFDTAGFRHAVDVMISAQEILVDCASYPTEKIAQNCHDFRPLGLGYANLGTLLMANGMPYDSDVGRDYAAAITAIMHLQSCLSSSRIAAEVGPFPRYEENRDSFLNVISMHRIALRKKEPTASEELFDEARRIWDECAQSGIRHGFRNAQVTVLAPTGTIAFMMDCDTTGIEPDLALVKYKKLVSGGLIRMVNSVVPRALRKLGYSRDRAADIVGYIEREGTIEGAPHLKEEHLPVFDCSLRPANGKRSIHYLGHLRMMAAVQPFLSGAISKTVKLPEEATEQEIADLFLAAWKLGIKAIAVYRDRSERAQPLSPGKSDGAATVSTDGHAIGAVHASRRRLPDERPALTHHFSVGGQEGYLTVGLYDDGLPGEVFIRMAKEGSTVSGLMDSFATAVSLALQYGVPLKVLCGKLSHMRFEPSGWTRNPNIGYAKSLMDYIFRWLELRFLRGEEGKGKLFESLPEPTPQVAVGGNSVQERGDYTEEADAPICQVCGSLMTRAGSCYRCSTCFSTSGCG
jgi:ribonucleoside-diphosphate reductase alpha chain